MNNLICLGDVFNFVVVGLYQVFPLLIEKFSLEEQASLVWQFLCSIPVNMIAEFLPWLSTSISADESQDLRDFLIKIVPEERLLQKVWFSNAALEHCCSIFYVNNVIFCAKYRTSLSKSREPRKLIVVLNLLTIDIVLQV